MWAFEVTDIGKVSHAKISTAPLVLLVGKNNTGKSYIATLLWTLTSGVHILTGREDARERRPAWFKAFVAKTEKNETSRIQVTERAANELIEHFNFELAKNGRELLKDAFAYDGFEQTRISTEADRPFVPFSATIYGAEPPEPDAARVRIIRFTITDEGEGRRPRQLRFANPPATLPGAPRAADRIFTELIYRVLLGPHNRRGTLYIPAARTGLMLSLRMMISQLFAEGTPLSTRLPRPLTDFLRRLTLEPSPAGNGGAQEQIARWLQDEIMHGKVEASEDEVPSFTYIPENTNVSVPLHAASSMITELAPFLILLKQGLLPRQIIFEEPEAHLHLSAQRLIARALARLVNLGVSVLVTSHSDTFVQQINNLMHLYQHPQRLSLMKELGYEEGDLINPADAKLYEFSERGDKTDVREVNREAAGFIVPSLNETLVNLSEETITLQDGEG
ncbi:MAG TPA: AAA family ATPase [Xanthobacteraceae bacterium]|nr:AAA family ATPase [Xanthobacteraceae bacterium]